jgi:hypothetical protein
MKKLVSILLLGALALVATLAHAGSYLDRAALLLSECHRTNEWVLAHLSDKELAAVAHGVAEGRVKAARGMGVPKEVAGVHPHLLLALENGERATAAAAAGDTDRFMQHLRLSRDEETIFRSLLAQQKLSLPPIK